MQQNKGQANTVSLRVTQQSNSQQDKSQHVYQEGLISKFTATCWLDLGNYEHTVDRQQDATRTLRAIYKKSDTERQQKESKYAGERLDSESCDVTGTSVPHTCCWSYSLQCAQAEFCFQETPIAQIVPSECEKTSTQLSLYKHPHTCLHAYVNPSSHSFTLFSESYTKIFSFFPFLQQSSMSPLLN